MPTLESLCARGVRFDNVWASPTCSPTRANLLTGRYGYKTGVGDAFDHTDEAERLPLSEHILPEVLSAHTAADYATALIGKWHLGPRSEALYPNASGFGHFAGALGATLVSAGDFRGALAALTKALKAEPRSSEAQLSMGDALAGLKHLTEATQAYDRALGINKLNSTAHTNLGAVKMEMNDLPGAISSHQTAIDIAPRNFRAHCNMGVALTRAGEMTAAVRAHRTAIRCNPRCSELHAQLELEDRGPGTRVEAAPQHGHHAHTPRWHCAAPSPS